MSDTVDIGAARVRLIVDGSDFEPIIEQGKRAITGFGTTAQQAYDRTEKGTRRAADALLDYVNSLGRADTTMDRYVRNASRMGVEKPVIDAATAAWKRYTDELEIATQLKADDEAMTRRAALAYKDLISTQEAAEKQQRQLANAQAQARIEAIESAQAQQRVANSQQDFNSLTAPGLTSSGNSADRRAAAEAAFLPIIERENAELEQQKTLAQQIAAAREEQTAANSQQDFNGALGIPEQQRALQLAQQRRDAEAAFLPIIEAEIAAERERATLQSNQAAFIKQLQNTEQAAGKTYYELLHIKAAELGISEAADPLIAKLKATNAVMGAGTISAKQYEFALRGLPAQFTDIFVSLAAGQNPLTVILQQGGQIKDMFGGIKTAVVAVAKETAKLVTNPWVLLATAVAALALAAYQASQRMEDLAIATAKGNQAAGNAKYLSGLAESLNNLDHIDLASADAAVSSLAEAGLLTGKNFKLAAEAAARWATITGQSADTVTAKFNQIARDPMQAILDGTVKVTDAQYAQLVSLERLGDKQGEVNLAVQLYYDQINNNSQSVLENLSATSLAWKEIKDNITSAWHAQGQFNGSTGDRALAGFLKGAQSTSIVGALYGGIKGAFDKPDSIGGGRGTVNPDAVVPSAAANDTLSLAQLAANKANQRAIDELGTKTQKYNAQLILLNASLRESSDGFLAQNKIIKNLDGTFSGSGYQKLVSGLRLKVFGEGPEPTKQIKAWEKTQLEALKGVQQANDYLYADKITTDDDYYKESRQNVEDEKNVQLKSINDQIKALRGRANSEDQIRGLIEQRAQVQTDAANKIDKLDRAEILNVRAKIAAQRDYDEALQNSLNQLQLQGVQAARGVGTGSRQGGLQNEQNNAILQAQLRLQKINNDRADNRIDDETADARRASSAKALSDQLELLQKNYDDLSTAESSYLNGSTKAWQDWSESVQNNAEFMRKVTTDGLDGIATSLTNLITTGKGAFADFLASLSKMIIEFGIKQTELAAINGSKDGGGFGGAINGILNLFSGSGSSGGGSSSSGSSSLFSNLGTFTQLALASARGNAFGGDTLASYRNRIVSQPTYFPFSRGGTPNVGLMGEKSGSVGEAIMPLTRTSGGELAVKTTGSQQQRPVNIQQTFVVPGAVTKSTQDQLAVRQYGAAQRAARRS